MGLERKTVPQFLLMLYDHLKESEDVLKEIGVCPTSPSQLACLVQLPLSSLFSCLQLFASWVRDGLYDFAALPLGVKTHISNQDKELIQQIPLKWTGREGLQSWTGYNIISILTLLSGSHGDLLEEIRQMIEVLKHSETHILKTANESAHVRMTVLLLWITTLRCNMYLLHILFLRSQSCSTFRRSNFLGTKTTFPDTFLPPFSYSITFLSE